MAGNTIWRGQSGLPQPRTINLPVAGAYVPGTFVENTATQLSQITTPVDKRPLILGQFDMTTKAVTDAYTSGDTGVGYELRVGDTFQASLAAATYTKNQPLTISASGRLAAAATTNIVVAFFDDTPGAYAAGALADVVIANFYTKP